MVGRELGELDRPKHRADGGAVAVDHVANSCRRAPVVLEEADVGVHSVADRAGAAANLLDQKLAGTRLRLPVGEDYLAVGVAVVVGDADLVQAIAAVAGVDPRQPLASTGARLTVTEVEQAGFERAVIRLAARVEPVAGGAGFQVAIADGAGHGVSSVCNIRAICVGRALWSSIHSNAGNAHFTGVLQEPYEAPWSRYGPIHAQPERQRGAGDHGGRGARMNAFSHRETEQCGPSAF